jgi:hypothetical protein
VAHERENFAGAGHVGERARGLGGGEEAEDVGGDVVIGEVEDAGEGGARHRLDDFPEEVVVQVAEEVAEAFGGKEREHRLAYPVEALEEVGLSAGAWQRGPPMPTSSPSEVFDGRG